MSPPLFLLGLVSFPTVWALTSLGLPSDAWTFGVMPVLSIFVLCDETRLREAAVKAPRSWVGILGAVIAVVFAILCASFAIVRHLLSRLCILLVWLFCIVKAFDFEKKMYTIDTFGEWSKFIVWNFISIFTGESGRMSYKGEWAYCCPYSRKRVNREIDHYYTLRKQTDESEREEIIPESFSLDFHIGSCKLQCEYTAPEDCSRENYISASLGDLFQIENLQLHEKVNSDMESSSSVIPSREVGGSSSKKQLDLVTEDHYILKLSNVNKLQVRLNYEDQILESYTFYDRPRIAITELRRALEVLDTEGNLIFSTLNRKIGSCRPRAHARCHEFRELFDLILNQGYKLNAVNLRAKYQCVISGHWSTQVSAVCLVGVIMMINYYQITVQPRLSIAIGLTVAYAVINYFLILMRCVSQEHLKRLVYCIISRTAPSSLDGWYRYFQVHKPSLTFDNESYGYPITSSQQQICFLREHLGPLPIMWTDSPRDLGLERLGQGYRVFNLRNLHVELVVTYLYNGENENVETEVQMRRPHNAGACCYREFFHTDIRRAANLIALLRWLEDHHSPGVCKEWPKRNLMHAYRYEELIRKVLNDGAKPMVTKLWSPIDISVE